MATRKTEPDASGLRAISARVRARVRALAWPRVREDLDERGYARLPELLTARECDALMALYEQPARFRSFVDMGQHRYGEGDYRYFARPLPPLVHALRLWLYPRLAEIANSWQMKLGADAIYPRRLAQFAERCHAAGQSRPTPLLLRYRREGFNRMHQDRYGQIAFPLQVAVLLTPSPGPVGGGEFLLSEQLPRQQTRIEAIALERGEGLVFPGFERPVEGRSRPIRAVMRHGVSRVHEPARMTLGIIFHDAS